MDEIYVIYWHGEKLETSANGYNTKQGAKTAITMFIKNHEESISREDFEIKTFVPYEEVTIMDIIKRIFKGGKNV